MKKYIKDFVEDLNYQGIILYISDSVNLTKLKDKMINDNMGHMYRFDYILDDHLFYVENCDLQPLDDISEVMEKMFEERYSFLQLNEDSEGFYTTKDFSTEAQTDILIQLIVYIQTICMDYVYDPDAYTTATNSLAYITNAIGGPDGCDKVLNAVNGKFSTDENTSH